MNSQTNHNPQMLNMLHNTHFNSTNEANQIIEITNKNTHTHNEKIVWKIHKFSSANPYAKQ